MCLDLQALVYDILPATTAIIGYPVGPRKLSANGQFFSWCSDGSKFVNTPTTHIISARVSLSYSRSCCVRQHKNNKNRSKNRNYFFFLPRADVPEVYVRASTLCCFHSLSAFRKINLTEGVDSSVRREPGRFL